MSWSRRSLIGLAALPLAACFRPMLAEDTAAAGLRGKVALPEIDGRFGYFLVQSLEDRLGKPAAPEYSLKVTSNVTERGLAVAQDNSVTRITLTAVAKWQLLRDGKPVLVDTARTQSGYNATSSLFATRQIRLDIERRLARDLGERISRLVLARADRLVS
ncbi:MAG: LPS assembly lipoprotein LptE [Pseudomonadota bacterium]